VKHLSFREEERVQEYREYSGHLMGWLFVEDLGKAHVVKVSFSSRT